MHEMEKKYTGKRTRGVKFSEKRWRNREIQRHTENIKFNTNKRKEIKILF